MSTSVFGSDLSVDAGMAVSSQGGSRVCTRGKCWQLDQANRGFKLRQQWAGYRLTRAETERRSQKVL